MGIKVLIWVLLNYGLMNIVVYSSLFGGFRTFFLTLGQSDSKFNKFGKFIGELVTCPMCFSTWGGFFIGIVIWSPINYFFNIPIEVSWFFDGILASGSVWAINSFVEFFEESRVN